MDHQRLLMRKRGALRPSLSLQCSSQGRFTKAGSARTSKAAAYLNLIIIAAYARGGPVRRSGRTAGRHAWISRNLGVDRSRVGAAVF